MIQTVRVPGKRATFSPFEQAGPPGPGILGPSNKELQYLAPKGAKQDHYVGTGHFGLKTLRQDLLGPSAARVEMPKHPSKHSQGPLLLFARVFLSRYIYRRQLTNLPFDALIPAQLSSFLYEL